MESDPSLDLTNEIELLQNVARGDRRAFEEIYDLFSGVLFSTALRVLNNREATEDVIQDVFIQIWEKAPLYDSTRGKPLTWAMTLTRNKAIDRLRSLQRRARLHEDAGKEAESAEQFDSHNALDDVESTERGGIVRAALEKLNKEQRQALEMAFFGSLTHTEIADRLGEPVGTVKARIRRGMMRLREALKDIV